MNKNEKPPMVMKQSINKRNPPMVMNESMNHQQQKPHGDASIDNRKSLMVMMNQWEEKKEPHGNESIHNPPKKFNHPW
jgi:hypothetical protein